jgi:two-component system response regulator FixJ
MLFEHRSVGGATPVTPAGAVHVVEDDPDLQRSLVRMLRSAGLQAHAYDRAADFLENAPRLPAGCVLTDFSMPGMDGLELIRRIQAAGFPFASILITGHAQVRLAVDAMRAGASDFIEKPFTEGVLLEAVRRALERRSQTGGRPSQTLEGLTPREDEVLRGVLAGQTNKLIARALRISPRTVEAHRASLMRKAGAATLSDLVRIALLAQARPDTRPPRSPWAGGTPRPPAIP